jgi:hypothetical protein
MSLRVKRWLALPALGALLLGGSGCFWLLAGAAAGGGTVAYVEGKLVKKYEAPPGRVWAAAKAAVKDLGFRFESEARDQAAARIAARRADDKPVHIDVKRLADKLTEVSVRVGTIGSKEDALQVMDAIDRRLGK